MRAVNLSSIDPVRALVQQVGGILGRQLSLIEATVADVPEPVVAGSGRQPARPAHRSRPADCGHDGADGGDRRCDRRPADLGYDGSGIGVAVIDSGMTAWHDDLAGPDRRRTATCRSVRRFRQRRARRRTTITGTARTSPASSRATASIPAASAPASRPAARLVVLKVLDRHGRGRISNVIAALDYVVAHKDAFNIRVVNLSVAAGVFESYNTDLLTLAAKRAVDGGIVVVAAAGNAGRNPQGRNAVRRHHGAGQCAVGVDGRRLQPHGDDRSRATTRSRRSARAVRRRSTARPSPISWRRASGSNR